VATTKRLRPGILTVIALAAFATVANAELQGWRTPEGGLYYGAEPPPGSVRIDRSRPTPTTRVPTLPTEPRPSPTANPRPTATARPTAQPTAAAAPPPTATAPRSDMPSASPTGRPTAPRRRATPVPRPSPTEPLGPEASSDAPADWRHEDACGEIVAIRDTRPTIDFERDLVVVNGEAVVIAGGSVKDLVICLSGSCVQAAPGKVLREGDTTRFSIAASRMRPTGFTVKCSVLEQGS